MLTKEQIEERRKGIGASDARYIVDGHWHELWLLKTGRKEPEDLSDIFAVQLGNVTEQLNLDWYEKKTGRTVSRRGELVALEQDYPLRATLDGWDAVEKTVIEAKHCNAYSKMDELRTRYAPQCQHQMIVTGARQAILSVIIGTNEPSLELIEFDEFFANEYIEKCHEFWRYVLNDKPPPGGEVVDAPVNPRAMRTVDMTGNNAWASAATDYLNHFKAAKLFRSAEKDIKNMVENDVREATGHGIVVKRNRAGALSIKEIKE